MKFPAFSIVQNKQLPNNINQIKHSSLKRIVWTPDPFFVNQKEGEVLDNPADNSLFKLSDTGKILKSWKLKYLSRTLIILCELGKYLSFVSYICVCGEVGRPFVKKFRRELF